jgi:hypothetical protein
MGNGAGANSPLPRQFQPLADLAGNASGLPGESAKDIATRGAPGQGALLFLKVEPCEDSRAFGRRPLDGCFFSPGDGVEMLGQNGPAIQPRRVITHSQPS